MFRFLCCCFVVFLAACGGGSGGGSAPAPTPAPAPVPAPVIQSFSASETSISAGASVNLTAQFTNGNGTIDNGVGTVTSGTDVTVTPAASTTYTLTVTNSANVSTSATVTVTVIEPVITSFAPSNATIMVGSSTNLNFVFSGGTGSIDNDIGDVTSGTAQTVTPSSTTTYTLTVTNENGVSTTSTATVTVKHVSVTIVAPTTGQQIPGALQVEATVITELDIDSVVATVGDRSTTLSFSDGSFKGIILLNNLPAGDYKLVVKATDVQMRSDTQERTFTRDTPPNISVVEPINYSVATPTLPVNVTCTDDVGDCDISVFVSIDIIDVAGGRDVLATSQNSISEFVDLSDYEGRTITLGIEAKDSINQTEITTHTIYVESSDKLVLVKNFPGRIIDFNAQKALTLTTDDTGDDLQISDMASDSFDDVDVLPSLEVLAPQSFLTPTGAIFTTREIGGTVLSARIYDWNQSQSIDLGQPNSSLSLTSAGDYALWSQGASLWRRTLSTQQNTLISTGAGNWFNSVAENGVVGYWATNSYSVLKYQDGVSTTLAADNDLWNTHVLTDGEQFIYRKHDPCCRDQEYAIALHDGTNEFVLTGMRDKGPISGRDFSVNNGWAAYTDLGGLDQTHVWSRDINGNTLQRTFSSSSSYIDYLAPNGEIMLVNSGDRYFSRGSEDLQFISSTLGKTEYIDGTWYVAIGRSLFEISGL